MAIPLEPATQRLFDIPFTEPFVLAPELEELGETVMARYDEFRAINEAVGDSELLIAWVWETKPFDPASDELTHDAIAKVRKAPDIWRCLAGGTHLAIQFRTWWWEHMDERQREAVVYHELAHVQVGRDEAGDLRIKLREHDIEEFGAVMRRFGAVIPGRQRFIDQYLAWNRALGKGEPEQMRTPEAIAADVATLSADEQELVRRAVSDPAVRKAARRLVKSVEKDGGSMTISATVDGKRVSTTIGRQPEPATADSLCPYPGCFLGADHNGAHALEDGPTP